MLSHTGAILNRSPLAILLSRSAQDISQGSFFSFKISSIYFEVVISFKSFYLTGANLSSKQSFYGVSFEWALTHRSIPRILPDSSYFPEISSNFLSKFDVRMNYHQSNVFLQDLSNCFHRWLNLFVLILPECLNNSWWCSRRHSRILKTEEEFLFNLALFSSRFMVLACCHPLKNCFRL